MGGGLLNQKNDSHAPSLHDLCQLIKPHVSRKLGMIQSAISSYKNFSVPGCIDCKTELIINNINFKVCSKQTPNIIV